MKVATVEQMRELDRRAVDEFYIPGYILMENAGLAVCSVIDQTLGVGAKDFTVLCGLGNNGGDGFVIARKLHSMGGNVKVFIFGDASKYSGDPKLNYEMLQPAGIDVVEQPDTGDFSQAIAHCDAIVDALLGTGIARDVGGRYREVIELANGSGKMVFAVDIPSGIDGNNGSIRGVSIRAHHTITFGLPKRGNVLFPGADLAGNLHVSHISFPPVLQDSHDILTELITAVPLPSRRPDGHKGSFGDVLFVAGAAGYFGAPTFSALALLKAGGGYARLAAPRSISPFLATNGPEIVFVPQEETNSGSLSVANEATLLELSQKVDLVVIGPGLSLHEETQDLVRRLVKQIRKPVLIDGDGLTALTNSLEMVRDRAAPTILTPHLGEMSRLTGKPVNDLQKDPIGAAQNAAKDLSSIVVLKGAHSIIAFPDQRVSINTTGNSGMASAGSGDVLTGTIAAMYGLGLSVENAVTNGVFLHGFSGDLAAVDKGPDGITARDLVDYLPMATNSFRRNYDSVTKDCYGKIAMV